MRTRTEARTPAGRPKRNVLYLHGRGDEPGSPPGDLVMGCDWPMPLRTPVLDRRWHEQRFGSRTTIVDEWLDPAALAIGHSFGGWLLLAAAARRLERGLRVPPLLMLSTVLGASTVHSKGNVLTFSLAPAMNKVHRALGLTSVAGGVSFSGCDLEFIQAADDEQCPPEPLARLAGGHRVRIVPGGHRLDHPEARKTVREALAMARDRHLTPGAIDPSRLFD